MRYGNSPLPTKARNIDNVEVSRGPGPKSKIRPLSTKGFRVKGGHVCVCVYLYTYLCIYSYTQIYRERERSIAS